MALASGLVITSSPQAAAKVVNAMNHESEQFPRDVFDEDGAYTIRKGARYCVQDDRIQELAEIGYARRDLDKAHDFVEACIADDLEDVHPLLEESLWNAAIVMYWKPFGRNNARAIFKASQFVQDRLGPDGLELHEYLNRCRNWMIAHDDGLGESKAIEIYLPPSPPRSTEEIGLYSPGRRVVAMGTDIARQLEPHFAQVRDILRAHEQSRGQQISSELLASRFAGLRLQGLASDQQLAVSVESVLALCPSPPKARKAKS